MSRDFKTMNEALETMRGTITPEYIRWQALEVFLRQLALGQGADLDQEIEDDKEE